MAVNSVISVACQQALVSSPCEQKGFCSSVKICERKKIQQASCVLNTVREKRTNEPLRRMKKLNKNAHESPYVERAAWDKI